LRRAALLAALFVVWAVSAAAEVRPVEALGVVPLDPDRPSSRAPRDAALQSALYSAVRRVALDELADFDPVAGESQIDAALGPDPLDYATRFRILEDRGERPALFSEADEVENEYVVLVEVHVDTDRVRERLVAAGLLVMPSGDGRRWRVRLVLEDVESFASYQAVRTLLEEIGARSALPQEMEAGRAVLVVDGTRSPDALVAALVDAAPSNLRLVPLGRDGASVRLRVRFVGGPPRPGAPAFDTTRPNRY
jgi:hypothetical protein